MADKQPVTNEAGTHIWLHNADTDGTWECPAEAAPLFVEHRGWEYTDAPGFSMSDLFDASTAEAEPTGFNPADHDVKEINKYLEVNLGSPGEIERVLALEAAGQDRATVKDPRPSTTDNES